MNRPLPTPPRACQPLTPPVSRSNASTLPRFHASTPPAPLNPEPSTLARFAAFSLIELLVTVTLLTFIIFGLLLMFNQTQRAFKTGMAQVDILENGRASMDMMVRELEQMTPAESGGTVPNAAIYPATNFLAELDRSDADTYPPLLQQLPGTSMPRTNITQRFFFLTRQNQDWIGIGYQVLRDDPNDTVGALYRLCVTNARGYPIVSSSVMYTAPLSAFRRIADGVVHLRLRAFDPNGVPLIATNSNGTWSLCSYAPPNTLVKNAAGSSAASGGIVLDQVNCYFWNNAVPAYLELELGILEPDALKRHKAIGPIGAPAGSVQRNYLSNHVAQVHLFRQRIPISNVDFTAYQ